MNRRIPAGLPITGVIACMIAAACTGNSSPYYRGTGTIRLTIDPPLSYQAEATADCAGVGESSVVSVFAEPGELEGSPVYFSAQLPSPPGSPDVGPLEESLPVVVFGLVGTGTDALPPTWSSTDPSQVELTWDGTLAGSVVFSDLAFAMPAPDQQDLPPMEVEGWPETISGSADFRCQPLREARGP